MNKYQLIVFDWDGTIIDSQARIVTCMQNAAHDANIDIPSDEATRDIIGLGLKEAVIALFPQLSPNELDAMITGYRHHWLGSDIPESSTFSGAEALLRALKDNEYLLAVATGKSRRGLDKDLKDTGYGHFFDDTICADESFSKPHPQMLDTLLVDLNVAPSEALMIGDTEYDIQMAVNAKVDGLGISHGVHTSERLINTGALAVVDSLPEVSDWIKNFAK